MGTHVVTRTEHLERRPRAASSLLQPHSSTESFAGLGEEYTVLRQLYKGLGLGLASLATDFVAANGSGLHSLFGSCE